MAVTGTRPNQFSNESTIASMSLELNYEDITLIWLDENVNENIDCLDTKCHLNTIANYLKVFADPQKTIDFIRSAHNEHIFLIVSGSFGESIVPQIHDAQQLKVIYIFCLDKDKHAEWTNAYKKVSGVFADKHEMFHHLTDKIRAYEKNLPVMSIFERKDTNLAENSIRDYVTESSITLMWLEVFFYILLHFPIDKDLAIHEMVNECRLYYKNNSAGLKQIDEFEKNYCPDMAIYWYTHLYQQLKQRHTNYIQSLTLSNSNNIIHMVYRGQQLGKNEIEKLKNSVGNFICPTSFFSATDSFPVAQSFVEGSPNSECVIFQIDIPQSYYDNITRSLSYAQPFSKLDELSQFEHENEVIFAMGTLFRIESFEEYSKLLVYLKLQGDNDEVNEMYHICKERNNKKHDWQSRRSVDDRILLLTEQLPESCRSLVAFYIKDGMFADENNVTTDKTLSTYQKGFDLLIKCLPGYDYVLTIAMYLSIGSLYRNKGERILALQFGEKALHIAKTHPDILRPTHRSNVDVRSNAFNCSQTK
ncbi:unnamed protein product [Adineta steineri]|uniref:NAD(P)(+)--arginine ADP-ribosyltransferase n=1 Tax=Adineta steineri TaxID=433720 RepID=A0A818PKR3_9BILA|nr:unnamed protein product [Adineta steineri]